MKDSESLPRLSRREVLKWFAAAAAVGEANFVSPFTAGAAPAAVAGYGTDPVLAEVYAPGDFWPLTLSKAQRRAATALADVILPADELGPAASALRVPDFVDEWVSAPYPQQEKDREVILEGLAWIDEESRRRWQKDFADLAEGEQEALCDDLCAEEQKDPAVKKAAKFFEKFTGICMGAYYGTPEGWAAIGYVGNVPSGIFAGPPPEVLDQLGLTQTVVD
jgi:hypothetical protein